MNKNNFKFDKEEKEINAAIEKNSLISAPISKKELNDLKAIARNTFAKTRSISIRISERDLLKIKSLASRKGIPYQTLISSTLHQKAEQSTANLS